MDIGHKAQGLRLDDHTILISTLNPKPYTFYPIPKAVRRLPKTENRIPKAGVRVPNTESRWPYAGFRLPAPGGAR